MQINTSNINQNKQQRNSNKVIAGLTTIGALTGGIYKSFYLSEKAIVETQKQQSTANFFIPKFLKCFNYGNAKKALKNESIDQQTFDKLRDTLCKAVKVLYNDRELLKIMKTPLSERTKSYSETLMKLFKSQHAFSKARSFLNKNAIAELNQKQILNMDQYQKLMQESMQKGFNIIKIRLKSISKGLVVGAGIGLAAGFGIKSIINDKEDTKKTNP